MVTFMESKLGEENQVGINRLQTKNDGVVIWLTGLSGSGKTTTGRILEKHFREIGSRVEFLDGDELRRTISSELGFSKEDRETHARRLRFSANYCQGMVSSLLLHLFLLIGHLRNMPEIWEAILWRSG